MFDRVIACVQGGHILNIGFGMGLVDNAIQRQLAEYKRKNPDAKVAHTIVEAHPEVYERMMAEGWGEKEGVTIVFGRWQDKMTELGSFDGELASFFVCPRMDFQPRMNIA